MLHVGFPGFMAAMFGLHEKMRIGHALFSGERACRNGLQQMTEKSGVYFMVR
jgi:hypothetical protein